MDWTKMTAMEIAKILDEVAAQDTEEMSVEEEMEDDAKYGYFDYWDDWAKGNFA